MVSRIFVGLQTALFASMEWWKGCGRRVLTCPDLFCRFRSYIGHDQPSIETSADLYYWSSTGVWDGYRVLASALGR